MPLISTVMPTYNSKMYVSQAIESVISQSFIDWELIIVDDGSTDSTLEFLEMRYSNEKRIKLIPLSENSGAAVARNVAIEIANGRFIAFLDSDDLWSPNKLSIQLNTFKDTNAYLVFSKYHVIRGEEPRILRTIPAPSRIVYNDLLFGDPIGCLTAIYDTEKTGKVYMPEIKMRQDWGLWMRILRFGNSYGYGIQKPLATLRLHSRSLTANKLEAMYYNYILLRTEGGLKPAKAMSGTLMHAISALSRRLVM